MIPILYEKNETAFTSNGLGRLSDTAICSVSETLNGEYELSLTYPADGLHADLLENDRLILAEPEDGMEPEPFRIYSVTKNMAGQIVVNAEHISYWLNSIMVMPFTATDVGQAMAGFKTHAAETCPFSFYTDRGTQGTFKVTVPQSIRSSFGGQAGSLLDVYGHGEFWFNRFDVHFNLHRGQDRHVTIRYGKNLVDLNQEEQIGKIFTGIVPYWADTNGENVVTLPEMVISSTAASAFSYSRTRAVDFSQTFQEQPTVAELRAAATSYLQRNGVGTPEVSITVDFVALWQTIEYENIAPLERVRLGDTVKVYFEKLGIEASAQVVSVDYDVLKGRYNSIELGSTRNNFASTYVTQIQETTAAVDQKITAVEQQIDADIDAATKAITGNSGGNVVIYDSNGDGEPDELLVMNTALISTATKLWRWNLAGLGYSSSGYNGTYGTAITMDGKINASYISTGTLNAANISVVNLSATSITSGTLKDTGGNFVLNMSTGALTAKKLSVTSTNFTLTEAGIVWMKGADITGKITATSGKIGLFDLDVGNGLKYLGTTVDGGSVYALIQLYRSRFRMWYNTTSTGAWQSGTVEAFGVQPGTPVYSNYDAWVRGRGYYSDGDIISKSYVIPTSLGDLFSVIEDASGEVTMQMNKVTSDASFVNTFKMTNSGVTTIPYTGATSGTATVPRKITIDSSQREIIKIENGWDHNLTISLYGYNPYGGSLDDYTNIGTGTITTSGAMTASAFNTTSDRRLKHDINPVDADAVAKVYRMFSPKSFVFNKDRKHRVNYGLIAQEVVEALSKSGINWPVLQLVTRGEDDDFYAIAYDQLHAFHITMIQGQGKRIEELENENRKLWAELDILKTKLEERNAE